jgi:hypothetical protein
MAINKLTTVTTTTTTREGGGGSKEEEGKRLRLLSNGFAVFSSSDNDVKESVSAAAVPMQDNRR